MGIVGQDGWDAGMFRGRRAPDTAAYDIVGLIDNEGQPFRRGGAALKSAVDFVSGAKGIVDAELLAGQRTFWWNNTTGYAFAADDETPLNFGTFDFSHGAAAAVLGGMLFLPSTSFQSNIALIAYAGSRKTQYFAGSVTATNGSATVTGIGTAWLANVDPGMILRAPGSGANSTRRYLVQTVDSDTQITLRTPYKDPTVTTSNYLLMPVDEAVFEAGGWKDSGDKFVEAASRRLLYGWGSRVYFSEIDLPFDFSATNYHEIPGGGRVTGLDVTQDIAIVFTTTGVWAIRNLLLDPFDDVGNIQHEVVRLSRDLILWGDTGVAGWSGGLVVPGVDNVYLTSGEGDLRPIGDSVSPIIRASVKAGLQPGYAAVHRGHYFLPIVNAISAVQQMLVCRLDRGFAWSRWTGYAAGAGYAQRVGGIGSRSPKLLGFNAAGTQIIDCSGCFDPTGSNKFDGDNTPPPWTIVTRDYDLGAAIRKHTATKLRAEYELVDAAADNPTLTASVAMDARETGATFANLTFPASAPETTGASAPVSWAVGRKGERARFQLTANGASADLRLKRLEVHVREAGF
jgi:hypothetical protein